LQNKRGSGRQKTAGRLFQSIEKFKMRFAKNISRAQAPSDPLPPWNDGAAKKVITDFLGRVTRGKPAAASPWGDRGSFPVEQAMEGLRNPPSSN
jgi:hypothetical protein